MRRRLDVFFCLLIHFFQARESAALRETLQAERQASAAELQALRAAAQKLEAKIKEMPQLPPVISEKELEERSRAEEKAAKEILRLTEVGLCGDPKPCLPFIASDIVSLLSDSESTFNHFHFAFVTSPGRAGVTGRKGVSWSRERRAVRPPAGAGENTRR